MKKFLIIILTLNIGLLQAQYTAIPDSNFEQALIDQGIDTEGILDGQVLTVDIAAIIELSINSRNIVDLTGIEYFIALEYLNVTNNDLIVLDIISSSSLKTLIAYGNSLISVNLPNSVEIAYLYNNNLASVDFSNHPTLKNLDVSENPLDAVNLENATSLEVLKLRGPDANVGDNLNITNCVQLKEIFAGAKLTSIDLSTNIALEDFQGGNHFEGAYDDFLIEIDFSNNPNLTSFGYINGAFIPLQRINFNNGNNAILTNVWLFEHAVTCIQVDDAVAANNGTGVYGDWVVPASQEYSADCFTIGIEEANIRSIAVFPNPTAGFLSVNIPDDEIKRLSLYNQIGEQVASFTTHTFDLSHLSNGVYFIKVEDKNQKIYITKILKQ